MSDETTETAETASVEPRKSRRMYTPRAAARASGLDPEIAAISAVMSALAPLCDDSVRRVLDYVESRTGAPAQSTSPAPVQILYPGGAVPRGAVPGGSGGTSLLHTLAQTDSVMQTPAPGVLKSPLEWLDTDEHRGTIILDNDGWTWDEWHDQAPITAEEFKRRLMECTILTGEAADRYREERAKKLGKPNPFLPILPKASSDE